MERLKQKLEFLADNLQDVIYKQCQKFSLIVVSSAKLLAPVDTGRLRASLLPSTEYNAGDTLTTTTKNGKGQIEIIIGTNVHYAIYQEMGTRYFRARPYLKPALEGNKDKLPKMIGDVILEVLTKVAKL